MFADPATWRDLLWLPVNALVGGLLAGLPGLLVLWGSSGVVATAGVIAAVLLDFHLWAPLEDLVSAAVYVLFGDGLGILLMGPAAVLVGLYAAPRLLRAHAKVTRALLGPTERDRLAQRVQHLAETRSDAVDTQAAELRRIERDLHDGAQARLVAMGMSLGAAEQMLEENPAAARVLLSEARETSAKALNELRELVRGIHPPVLADRGLGDAVQALALESPLAVEVSVDLPGRVDVPVESAAYFAVSELLTNAAKHAAARRVWVDLRYRDGVLRMTVTDDGRGGATLSGGDSAGTSPGTGLRGIERRLATFDGVITLTSPPGGPTVIMMELPCALSSPKTSSS